MTNDNLVKRSYSFDVRAEEQDGVGILTGRPIVYEQKRNMGCYDEIIARGALDGANLKDIRFLVNHDTKMIPLARSRRNNGNSTMKLSIDYDGMNIDFVKLDLENNSTARALFSAVKRGDLSGMSFMFSIDGEKWRDLETEHPTRVITKIGTVLEVSACTFPAYEQTEINARDKAALESARSALEKARQERAAAVDTADQEALALAKEQFNFLFNYGG